MSSSTMTLVGLNNFLQSYETDLFEFLAFPEGIDKDTAIENILLFCGDNELLYADGNFMRSAIDMWSKKWYFTFDKWVKVLAMYYNPIENYDRMEAWSDSTSMSESSSMSSSESNSASASDSSSSTGSENANVSAFNSSTLQPDTSAADQRNNVASSTSNGTGTRSEHDNHSKNDLSEHRGRVHGNIGVTTTQQMIKQEIELVRFNIYDEIAVIFAREFTLAL